MRLWPPQGLGETCLGRGGSVAREECQRGYKPELGFSQSLVHSSAPQPWDRKTGQLLVSHRVRFPTPSTWDRPQGPFLVITQLPPGIKPFWFSRRRAQWLTTEPLSGNEKAVFQSWGHQKGQLSLLGAPLWAWCMFPPSQGPSTPTGQTRTVVHTQASCLKTWDTETGQSSHSFVNTHHALT